MNWLKLMPFQVLKILTSVSRTISIEGEKSGRGGKKWEEEKTTHNPTE